MNKNDFSVISGKLCNLLFTKGYDKGKVNSLIDDLNAKPFKTELFVSKHDAASLLTALCLNIKAEDESLSAKTCHLMNNIITRQNVQLSTDYLVTVISWYLYCLKTCSEIILPDILHGIQCILQYNPQAGHKFTNELIGQQGILTSLVEQDKSHMLSTHNPLQVILAVLKCMCSLTSITEESKSTETGIAPEIKEHVAKIVLRFLMRGTTKSQDEFLYCKAVITGLRLLTQLYYNDQKVEVALPEIMGLCRHFTLYGLRELGNRPEKIMPAQQTVAAAAPHPQNSKGGKKQKIRKHRNNAIESLKKEIPLSDCSFMKDVGNFENTSAYKPASQSFLEPLKSKTCWALTSDSDMSDMENSREAKLIALKSRVRLSAGNLFLVLIKITEKKDMFGYWWALFPDSPDCNNWSSEESAKKTLIYCAVTDPILNSRASVLSVILAFLSGSRIYLFQAECSKKETTSFIPFSVSLGNMICCLHKALIGLLESERSHSVIIITLKCCAALVQATPYHKMKEGLIMELVRSTRKFLVHRDVTLQVGALITMGCVLSVDPKVDEVLKAIEKDTTPQESTPNDLIIKDNVSDDDCEDFEEGYSDDEMFSVPESIMKDLQINDKAVENNFYFKSWILDICFKNMGWVFKDNEVTKCRPSVIPVVLESLQVLSAIAFHHMGALLVSRLALLADVLSEALQHDHHDVVLQAARTVSIVGDAILKLEHTDRAPPLAQCVNMWEKLLVPLSNVLQSHDNPTAKATVCDCIANVGEKTFKELPRRVQVLWCALLVGSCGSEDAAVRAAAVRALACAVVYRTLREDMCFVSDCGENILRALAEPTLMVRAKAAWALGNLSDALVLNMEEPDIDEIDDDLLRRLLEVSVQCAADNDKVKMSATRALGNLLRLIKQEHINRNSQMKTLCETAIDRLLACACKVANMKVRWNACYALGNAMKNDNLFTCLSGWQAQVFPSLGRLAQECKNLKVRINAASALRAGAGRAAYGAQLAALLAHSLAALDAALHVHDYADYRHKDNLIEQLCVTLAHLTCLLTPSDLTDVLDPLVFHFEVARGQLQQLCHRLPPEHASCLKILQAAKHVTVDLHAAPGPQAQALAMLQEMFIWDI